MTLALLAAAAALALAYWSLCDRMSWFASALKTGSTGLLALAGVTGQAPALILAGLALGSLGDLALSRPGQRAFLAGMAAFAAGHLAYVAQFAAIAKAWPPTLPALVLLALALSTEWWLAPRTGALRGAVRAYVVIIAAMGWMALALPSGHGLTKAGAALFVASDLMLAARLFVAPGHAIGKATWPAYWLGQALILLGSR